MQPRGQLFAINISTRSASESCQLKIKLAVEISAVRTNTTYHGRVSGRKNENNTSPPRSCSFHQRNQTTMLNISIWMHHHHLFSPIPIRQPSSMPRSPSPSSYRRRFRSPSPPRGYGPSRGGDRYRARGDDDRDRRGGDRGGRSWHRGRDRSRERERDGNRDWDNYYRRREGSPAASASASASAVGTQPASRTGTPEEGQITSPEARRRTRSPPPARRRSRSPRRSPSPRRYNDRFSDRFRGGYNDMDRRRGDWGRRRSRSRSPRRDRGSPSPSVSPRSPRREARSPRRQDSRSPSPRRRSPEPPRPSSSSSQPLPGGAAGVIPPTARAPPTGPRMDRLPPTGPRAFGPGGRVPSGGEPPSGPSASRMPWAQRAQPPPRAGTSPATTVGSSPYGAASPSAALGGATPTTQIPAPSPLTTAQGMPPAPAVPEDPEAAARLREARILAELPQLKVSFVGAWEAELAAVQAHVAPLQQATLRAQASQRVAEAVLADAEAERLAAGERRRICEEHVMAGSLDAIIG